MNCEINKDFEKALDLMQLIQEATIMAIVTQAEIDETTLQVVSRQGHSLASWQLLIAEKETELEKLCRAHPEWFENRKRIDTTYGRFQMQSASHTEIPDPEATIRKIRRRGLVKKLLRPKVEINVEAAELLDEKTRKSLGIFTVEEQKFKATPKKTNTSKILDAMRKKKQAEATK